MSSVTTIRLALGTVRSLRAYKKYPSAENASLFPTKHFMVCSPNLFPYRNNIAIGFCNQLSTGNQKPAQLCVPKPVQIYQDLS